MRRSMIVKAKMALNWKYLLVSWFRMFVISNPFRVDRFFFNFFAFFFFWDILLMVLVISAIKSAYGREVLPIKSHQIWLTNWQKTAKFFEKMYLNSRVTTQIMHRLNSMKRHHRHRQSHVFHFNQMSIHRCKTYYCVTSVLHIPVANKAAKFNHFLVIRKCWQPCKQNVAVHAILCCSNWRDKEPSFWYSFPLFSHKNGFSNSPWRVLHILWFPFHAPCKSENFPYYQCHLCNKKHL